MGIFGWMWTLCVQPRRQIINIQQIYGIMWCVKPTGLLLVTEGGLIYNSIELIINSFGQMFTNSKLRSRMSKSTFIDAGYSGWFFDAEIIRANDVLWEDNIF